MNGGNVCTIGTILAVIALAGCETYKPYTNPASPPPKLKHAAVMVVPNSKEKRRRANDIADVLQKRGIEPVIVEPGDPVPRDVDGYFTYTDKWEWDLTMYLADMEIELHETQTSRLISSARYKQGWVHRYPDPIEIVDNLVGQILGEPPKPPRRANAPENSELIKH
jgi:hypothetical protein